MAKKAKTQDDPVEQGKESIRAILNLIQNVSVEEYLAFLDWLGSEVELREMAAQEED